jgi:hypothetical protein
LILLKKAKAKDAREKSKQERQNKKIARDKAKKIMMI